MTVRRTTLRLPAELKARIDRLAGATGQTPHALMLRAIEARVGAMELHRQFIKDSIQADQEMEATGLGYAMDDVATYIRARLAGKKVNRPKPISWRK